MKTKGEMSFSFRALLIFGVLVSTGNANALTFADEVGKCAAAFPQWPSCDEGVCKEAALFEPCFKAMKLSKADCIYGHKSILCSANATKEMFPGTHGFELRIPLYGKAPARTVMSRARNITKATIHGFEVNEGTLDVSHATRERGGSWTVEKPNVAFGFESVLAPRLISVEEFTTPKEIGLSNSTPENCVKTFIDDSVSNNESRVLALLNLEEPNLLTPERHFVGRKGKPGAPIVKKFKTLKVTKVCSKTIPAGTLIESVYDTDVCTAAADGAVKLNLPSSFFSKTSPSGESREHFTCAPKALARSQRALLTTAWSKTGKLVIPKVDWQDCDCAPEVPLETSKN